MSYIGSTPTTQSFIAGTDSFNGTGSQTDFTLTRLVNSTNDIQVVVNNVVQYPPNYSVSGNTLTISPAPSSGTNNVYVRYLSTTLQTITPSDLTVSTAKIQTSAVITDKIADANITAAKLDGAQSGSAPIYGARAWVNFNGTGTVAIRASGNVSSITDNGTGNYTVNFTTALPDTNYAFLGTANGIAANSIPCTVGQDSGGTKSTSALQILVSYDNNVGIALADVTQVSISIFR
jgi:hypothetical protein